MQDVEEQCRRRKEQAKREKLPEFEEQAQELREKHVTNSFAQRQGYLE